MHAETLTLIIFFIILFLIVSTVIKWVTDKTGFPFTIAMLTMGFLTKAGIDYLHVSPEISIGPDLIFFVLLPLLLYESATHIHWHHFRIQFKTITFMATFGLLVSVAVVGVGLSAILGLPLVAGLLFGTIISATDPISVLALFKQLGAPKRLGLLCEGESMFNDATAVIAFRMMSLIAVSQISLSSNDFALQLGTFLYVFIGSILVGALMGWITSQFISRVNNDLLVETTLTVALSLGSFLIPEHFFHLSGVISTVAAGLTMGNIGKTKISSPVFEFMEKFWEYIAFLAVSIVFFFAAYDLDPATLLDSPGVMIIVVGVVILARAVSSYASFFITNRVGIFEDEPDVPLDWQHVINWAGLRGVIPLVLAYSLPHEYLHRELFIGFTLEVFLFSLIVQGLSIKRVLFKYRLNVPTADQVVYQEEKELDRLYRVKEKIAALPLNQSTEGINAYAQKLLRTELDRHHLSLQKLAKKSNFLEALQLRILQFERHVLHELYRQQYLPEAAVMAFNSELDLQEDALLHPGVNSGRSFSSGGLIKSQVAFERQKMFLKKLTSTLPFLRTITKHFHRQMVFERISLLQARILTSDQVVLYLKQMDSYFEQDSTAQEEIRKLKGRYQSLLKHNHHEISKLEEKYPQLTRAYFKKEAERLVWSPSVLH